MPLQYYWPDGNYIGNLNPRTANPYIHVSSIITTGCTLPALCERLGLGLLAFVHDRSQALCTD